MKIEMSISELNAWFDAQCTRCAMRNCEWQDCKICKKNEQYKKIMKEHGIIVKDEDDWEVGSFAPLLFFFDQKGVAMDDSLLIILQLVMISWSIFFVKHDIIEQIKKIERRLDEIADNTES